MIMEPARGPRHAIDHPRGPKLFTTSSPKDKRHNNVNFFRQRSLERTMDCVDTDYRVHTLFGSSNSMTFHDFP